MYFAMRAIRISSCTRVRPPLQATKNPRPPHVGLPHRNRLAAFSTSPINCNESRSSTHKPHIPAPKMNADELKLAFGEFMPDPNAWSREQLEQHETVNSVIPSEMMLRFLSTCLPTGELPGGMQSRFPQLRDEDILLLMQPYSTWAPAPHAQHEYSLWIRSNEFFSKGHFMEGDEHPRGSTMFPARLTPLKARILSGMEPMCEHRRKEMKLDELTNINQFLRFLDEIDSVFAYWNLPEVQEHLRISFKVLSANFRQFDEALNAKHSGSWFRKPTNTAEKWHEFVHANFTAISARTYQWVRRSVHELYAQCDAEYEAAIAAAKDDLAAKVAAGKKLHARYGLLSPSLLKACVMLNIKMPDFGPEFPPFIPPTTSDPNALKIQLQKMTSSMSFSVKRALKEHKEPDKLLADPEFMKRWTEEDRNNLTLSLKQTRPEPNQNLGEEFWITCLKSTSRWNFAYNLPHNHPARWGFVCYRLTYKQTDAEWSQFMHKLNQQLGKRGPYGIDSSKELDNHPRLLMIDGRDEGIAEGDTAAAREHFQKIMAEYVDIGLRRVPDDAFLAIDFQTVKSHGAESKQTTDSADNAPHMRLVTTLSPDDIFAAS
ncbi:unnamed protein product [Periconia digitata]|uniref:Uncharacterized protein n=1 Tax=Periconia digitata TaxID=1303443 RepID=A0A9W4US48_9PLEO|nr:unnamed protein product [Periconia digitata]